MGSGPLARKKGNKDHDTSGKTGNKSSSPYSSRVITGLPLRVSPAAQQITPQPAVKAKGMAGKDEVFGKVSNIVLVLGASVSVLNGLIRRCQLLIITMLPYKARQH